MKKVTLSMLIFLMFVNQIMYVFGNISILSEPVNSTGYRKLICVSKDDDSALVWVNKLNYSHITNSSKQIYSSNRHINNEIDCKMNDMNEECLKSWRKQNWSFTSSLKTPMGPVFDERWEDFIEYDVNGLRNGGIEIMKDSDSMRSDITTTIVLSFLRYTTFEWYILFCDIYHKIFRIYCERIEIGQDNSHNYYVMDKCVGLSITNIIKHKDSCSNAIRYIGKRNSNWQTFTIIWNRVTRNISFYTDGDHMTYEDNDNEYWSDHDYHSTYIESLYYRSTSPGKIRFHIYDFLHTTMKGAILTSPTFTIYNQTICIKMLIGLCVECDANIILLNSANNITLKNVTIKGLAAKHGLPMWQSVEIKKNLATTNNVTIQLIPKLNAYTSNPLWAIANVRQCPQNGTLKAVVVHQKVDEKNVQHSPVGCQKLFYGGQTNLSSWSNLKIEHENCPRGKIGPQCLISCEHDLQTNANCSDITVCNNNGCTYPLGYCSTSCKRLEKPNVPKVIFVDQTSIRVVVVLPTTWNYTSYYEETAISYSFEIRGPETHSVGQSKEEIFQNTTQLTGHFKNLKPCTGHEIRCISRIPGYKKHSDWITVWTHCDNKSGLQYLKYMAFSGSYYIYCALCVCCANIS